MNLAATIHSRDIWKLTYPLMLSMIFEHLIGLTDTIFLGRVSEVALGASALGGVYYLALFMIAQGFGTGAQIIIARRNGEQRFSRIGPTLVQGCYFAIGLAVFLLSISYIFTPQILQPIIDSSEVYSATCEYLYWRLPGLLFSMVCIVFRAFYVGTGMTKTLTLNSVVMVLSNVVLNYCLIFGACGLPKMGIAGAALASTIAEAISLVFFLIYTKLTVDKKKLGFSHAFIFRPRLLAGMLKISGWTMVQSFVSIAVWFIFFLAIEHLGERPLAITNIVRNISAQLYMIIFAYAITAEALISNQIGAGNSHLIPKTCIKCISMAYLTLLPVVLFIYCLPELCASLFTDDESLITGCPDSIFVMLGSLVLYTPATVVFCGVSGTGNTKTAFVLELSSICLYSAFIYWGIYILRPDVAYCWFAEYVYASCLLILSSLYLKFGKWQHKKI